MLLYHCTSLPSLIMIRKAGYIGLNGDDYARLIRGILTKMEVPPDKIDRYCVKEVIPGVEEYAPNGMVSFWPYFKLGKASGFYSLFGRNNGESFGHTLWLAIKYGARVKKQKADTYRYLLRYFKKHNIPVVIEVDLPVYEISNVEQLHNNTELYTKGKVPFTYAKRLFYLSKDGTTIIKKKKLHHRYAH